MPTTVADTQNANSLANWADQIVFHYDGNNNDPDDIAAMPVAALLTAASGNADKTTFLYGNSLTENTNNGQLALLEDAASFAETLGIATRNYQDDVEGTTNSLVDMLESGQKILAIEGGPMEAIYRALERTDPQFHDNVKLLSHNTWNDNRAEGSTPYASSPRTWSDIGDDFPDVEQIHIRDQNWGSNDDTGFYNRNWDFMDTASDPVLQAAREAMVGASQARGESTKKNDASDAGMMWFVLTGEEDGTAQDAETYLASSGLYDLPYDPDGTVIPTPPVDVSPDEPTPEEPTPEEPTPPSTPNSAPQAMDDVAQTGQNQTILVDVLANDLDADADTFILTDVSYNGNSSLVSIENNQIKVNPLNAYQNARIEEITYTIDDGNGGTSTASLQVTIGDIGPELPIDPPVEPPVDTPVDNPNTEGTFSLNVDEDTPLSSASYDASSGDLMLDFDLAKLLQSSGQWGNARHIDGLTLDGAVYDLSIHDDNGPRDGNGNYIYDETTMEDMFTINIGAGRDPADGTLDFGLTDNANGTRELYTFELTSDGEEPSTPSVPSEEEPVVQEPPVTPDTPDTGLLSLFLADADSDQTLSQLFDGATIAADSLGDATTFYANAACDDIAYVQIMFEDFMSTERVEPYALFGDNGGDFNAGLALDAGNYTLTARAFDDQNIVLEDLSITFDLI